MSENFLDQQIFAVAHSSIDNGIITSEDPGMTAFGMTEQQFAHEQSRVSSEISTVPNTGKASRRLTMSTKSKYQHHNRRWLPAAQNNSERATSVLLVKTASSLVMAKPIRVIVACIQTSLRFISRALLWGSLMRMGTGCAWTTGAVSRR
jgi:hypothetical protein